jgi:CBS domain containing-hemolysin-like protein
MLQPGVEWHPATSPPTTRSAAREVGAMTVLILPIVVLVLLGSLLALAETAITRISPSRAVALEEEKRRNAVLLERLAGDPARYLNAVYLAAVLTQNGSAILVAIVSERYFGHLGITLISVGFTLAYFVVVDAMSKTFAILHSDRVALALAPFVWVVGRSLALPTRLLIGLANVLLPGKGLKSGPFVTQAEIRSMAEVGHQEGSIETHEKEIIHSVFEFGGRVVQEVMVPRPDIIAVELSASLHEATDLMVQHGVTRLPAYRGDLDHTEGIVHGKDVLEVLHLGRDETPLANLLRPVPFVPESKRLSELLREMQADKVHMAMVTDEFGLVAGLVTLEDLLEELVGQIRDEHDDEPSDIVPLGDSRYRVNAALPITELNEVLGGDLPHEGWNTVGGLAYGLAGKIPAEGEGVELPPYRFTVEKLQGRRIMTVLVERLPSKAPPEEPDAA